MAETLPAGRKSESMRTIPGIFLINENVISENVQQRSYIFTLVAFCIDKVAEIHPLSHPWGRNEYNRDDEFRLVSFGTIPKCIGSKLIQFSVWNRFFLVY